MRNERLRRARSALTLDCAPIAVSGVARTRTSSAGDDVSVTESSERWRASAERVVQSCPDQADLAYIEELITRIKLVRFGAHSTTLAKIQAAKAERGKAIAQRRMRYR